MTAEPVPLRVKAQDEDDLAVVSAAMQDAIVRVADIRHDGRARALIIAATRYRWEGEREGDGERVRAIMRVESVLDVKARGIGQDRLEGYMTVLSITFSPKDEPPAGVVNLTFAGGGEIAVNVECVDIALADASRPWPARGRPAHETDDD